MTVITRSILTAFVGWLLVWLALWGASALVASHSYQATIEAISTAPVVDERDV